MIKKTSNMTLNLVSICFLYKAVEYTFYPPKNYPDSSILILFLIFMGALSSSISFLIPKIHEHFDKITIITNDIQNRYVDLGEFYDDTANKADQSQEVISV